jgi:hypothetical protein
LSFFSGEFHYYNGHTYGHTDLKELWNGGYYMADGQTISPSVPLYDCPHGWLLCWSEFTVAQNAPGDYDFVYTFIPRNHVSNFASLGVHNIVSSNTATNYAYLASKYLYVSSTSMTGHTLNNEGTNQNIVLRKVFMM